MVASRVVASEMVASRVVAPEMMAPGVPASCRWVPATGEWVHALKEMVGRSLLQDADFQERRRDRRILVVQHQTKLEKNDNN